MYLNNHTKSLKMYLKMQIKENDTFFEVILFYRPLRGEHIKKNFDLERESFNNNTFFKNCFEIENLNKMCILFSF